MNAAATAITRARNEVAEENQKKAVEMLKVKLRELSAAETVVSNIVRETKELEIAEDSVCSSPGSLGRLPVHND